LFPAKLPAAHSHLANSQPNTAFLGVAVLLFHQRGPEQVRTEKKKKKKLALRPPCLSPPYLSNLSISLSLCLSISVSVSPSLSRLFAPKPNLNPTQPNSTQPPCDDSSRSYHRHPETMKPLCASADSTIDLRVSHPPPKTRIETTLHPHLPRLRPLPSRRPVNKLGDCLVAAEAVRHSRRHRHCDRRGLRSPAIAAIHPPAVVPPPKIVDHEPCHQPRPTTPSRTPNWV
jgi:hypothetical protein